MSLILKIGLGIALGYFLKLAGTAAYLGYL